MWGKIKKWFGFADLNNDGKFTAEDIELVRAIAEEKYKKANDKINTKVAATKNRVNRIKEEVGDVLAAAKEVANQAGDVVDAAKGKSRTGRKKK